MDSITDRREQFMKRSTSKLYKPWFGTPLVLACGGAEVDELKTTEGELC